VTDSSKIIVTDNIGALEDNEIDRPVWEWEANDDLYVNIVNNAKYY
jgi:hypothetical protein